MKFSFDRMANAVGRGIEQMKRSYGIEPDPDVRAYNALQPDDFDAIAREFGMEQTSQYIEDMERRRIKRG